jgi:diguanylate cyclase (GGDEF)-like protein/PAS domain S-box-containing protein
MFTGWNPLGWAPFRFLLSVSGAVATSRGPNAAAIDQDLFDVTLEALNVARDNKALVVAREGCIISVNELATQLCGRSSTELLGKRVFGDLFQKVPEREPGSGSQRWQTGLKSESDGSIEVEVVRQQLGASAQGMEVYAIRDLRERRQVSEEWERQNRTLRQREKELHAQNMLFDAAMNNMTQGLNMFDSAGRLLLTNQRYLEMYGLSPEVVKPGCSLRELVKHRIERGSFFGIDPERYVADLESMIRERRPSKTVLELNDGRVITVVNQPIEGGGWVVTHEDITERHNLLLAQRRSEELVREQKLQLDTALNNMVQGLCMFDAQGRIIIFNQHYAEMMGLPAEFLTGRTLLDLFKHRKATGQFTGDPEQFFASVLEAVRAGETKTNIMQSIHGRALRVVDQPLASGGWVATFEDITEQLRVQRERDRNREFLDMIIDNVPAAILVKATADQRYVLVNRTGEAYWGLPRDEILGRRAREIFPAATADMIEAYDKRLLETRVPHFFDDHTVVMPGNRTRTVTSKHLPIMGEDGEPQYLVTVIDDVTERRTAEARIAHMARHDALTGVANRMAFAEHLATMLDRGQIVEQQFSLLSFDLDRFKEVNDVFGHGVGDSLLCELSRRFEAAADGAFLARLGGDEFAVVSPLGQEPATGEAIAERLLESVSGNIDVEGHPLRVGISIGISVFPNDGRDGAALTANADAALYRAKAEGRGTVRFFEADMDRRLRERRALQHDLQMAVGRGQIILHYQPQARIDGDTTGFEALARWQHPLRGLVPPGVFIPLAEESGLILSIGEWILREACREAASWPKPLQIAINLSPVQFRHGDLPGLVHSVLLETGLSPSRLELEITEGVLIGDHPRALSILRRLKTLGVQIAMDDFGTGYSSLSYLQSFPFDKIKIDRSFIANVEQNLQSAAIVRAVIALARGLDLPVIAEGVETEDQLAFLGREACNEVQGYLVGRPCPIDEYAKLVGRAASAQAQLARRT